MLLLPLNSWSQNLLHNGCLVTSLTMCVCVCVRVHNGMVFVNNYPYAAHISYYYYL